MHSDISREIERRGLAGAFVYLEASERTECFATRKDALPDRERDVRVTVNAPR